jgi:hypothetical protein
VEDYLITEAKSFEDIINVYWLDGELNRTPDYMDCSLEDEDLNLKFRRMNQLGFLTLDSQTYLNEEVRDGVFNYQRPYVYGLISTNLGIEISKKLGEKYQVFLISGVVDMKGNYALTFDEVEKFPVNTSAFSGFRDISKGNFFSFEHVVNSVVYEQVQSLTSFIMITYPRFHDGQ